MNICPARGTAQTTGADAERIPLHHLSSSWLAEGHGARKAARLCQTIGGCWISNASSSPQIFLKTNPFKPFVWWSFERMAESEVDTPSTPIEYESKYFEYHGVRLPPFCRGKMDEIANFSLRSSDIWIVTYPKSGIKTHTSEYSLYACFSLIEDAVICGVYQN